MVEGAVFSARKMAGRLNPATRAQHVVLPSTIAPRLLLDPVE